MTNEIKRLENEIKELEKANYLNRNLKKIELLRKKSENLKTK